MTSNSIKDGMYGTKRVVEPKGVLPTSAWKLNAEDFIHPEELKISIKRIHIESASFRQISVESGHEEDRIRDRILDVVRKRGKLHNPITDTGGVLFGSISEIGSDYPNPFGFKIGDEVICNASLAGIPLFLKNISSIDFGTSQIEAEGYAIVSPSLSILKKPDDVPISLFLYALNESGTLKSVYESAQRQKRCLVVGNNILTSLLYGLSVRKGAGKDAEIICLFDNKTDLIAKNAKLTGLLEEVFTSIHSVNIIKPIECLNSLNLGLYDLSVNCADLPGAETLNIFLTKEGGTVYFANMVNNYNIALYITELIGRKLDIRCATGYDEDYTAFNISILRKLAGKLSKESLWSYSLADNVGYALRKNVKKQREDLLKAGMADDFICESKAMRKVLEQILAVAKYDCNVLITGDTGVGKEKVAGIIQKNSARSNHPFIKINCSAISEKLIESEFFGYEKGAFTGASPVGKKGFFEVADGGIIFLDEVGDLPLDMQAKLLRVIQDGEFYRVGGTKSVHSNVRIISATNRSLEGLVEKKLFRKDLFYRLNVFPLRVPPLSERRAEIPALVQHFIEKYNRKYDANFRMDSEAIAYMATLPWEGNIRELENTVQRLMISTPGEYIGKEDVYKILNSSGHANGKVSSALSRDSHAEGHSAEEEFGQSVSGQKDSKRTTPEDFKESFTDIMDSFERGLIRRAIEEYGSSRKAARGLGISQTQFLRRKRKHGL